MDKLSKILAEIKTLPQLNISGAKWVRLIYKGGLSEDAEGYLLNFDENHENDEIDLLDLGSFYGYLGTGYDDGEIEIWLYPKKYFDIMNQEVGVDTKTQLTNCVKNNKIKIMK